MEAQTLLLTVELALLALAVVAVAVGPLDDAGRAAGLVAVAVAARRRRLLCRRPRRHPARRRARQIRRGNHSHTRRRALLAWMWGCFKNARNTQCCARVAKSGELARE